MCGIFGITIKNNSAFRSNLIRPTVDTLFKLSESRGKEASGLAILSSDAIEVYKTFVRASHMIRSEAYNEMFERAIWKMNTICSDESDGQITVIGHSRLVTNGAQMMKGNNQPVVKDGIVLVHNGIIVNHEELWKKFPLLTREYEVDSEIIPSLIRHLYNEKKSLVASTRGVFELLKGAASIAAIFEDLDCLLLATNTGSLYLNSSRSTDAFLFGSEQYILSTLIRRRRLGKLFEADHVLHLEPMSGCLVNLSNLAIDFFSLSMRSTEKAETCDNFVKRKIVDNSCDSGRGVELCQDHANLSIVSNLNIQLREKALPGKSRQCSKCILPETMPFIEFDHDGVCGYCRKYVKLEPRGPEALEELVSKYRSGDRTPDCIVGISGGRDSTYGLHYIKTVLKMNPVAYTYDWGMVTDLARRNISRICGKLGIEHILVSADIGLKRKYIRNNVQAWLKKPALGTIPLFMAGDKQYFYYAEKVRRQVGAKLIFLCENMLERTDFKTGFCNVRPKFDQERMYTLSFIGKIKLAQYYLKEYLTNPRYINSSIIDTLGAYFCYYMMPRNYLNLYRYIKWDEKMIISTLINEYEWECATDTEATWRIGDGTAAFYNYIYYTVAGFTENDTFRSNQIREGIITREQALRFVEKANQPRYDSIKWYCDTIGIDFNKTMQRINRIPKLYKVLGYSTLRLLDRCEAPPVKSDIAI